MALLKVSTLAVLSGLIYHHTTAQTVTYGATGCSGLLSDGHCCDGSIIALGGSSATCCVGDPKFDLINPSGSPNININGGLSGNGLNVGNILSGPSTCTAGTSTAFTKLPATASSVSPASSSGSMATSSPTSSSSEAAASSDSTSSTMSSSAGASSQSSAASSASVASTSSHNAAWKPAATAAPFLAGAMLGVAAFI